MENDCQDKSWADKFEEWRSQAKREDLEEGVVETMYELLKECPTRLVDVFRSITDTMIPIITIDMIVYHATDRGQQPANLQQITEEGSRSSSNYLPPNFLQELSTREGYEELLQRSINLGGTIETPDGKYTVTQKTVDGLKAMYFAFDVIRGI